MALDLVPIQNDPYSVTPDMVSDLVPGSQIRITERLHGGVRVSNGTVLCASPNGVAIVNCISSSQISRKKETIDQDSIEIRRRALVESGDIRATDGWVTIRIPVQWISIQQMTSVFITSRPAEVEPQFMIDMDDGLVDFSSKDPLNRGMKQLGVVRRKDTASGK